jgi:hypothetical protein
VWWFRLGLLDAGPQSEEPISRNSPSDLPSLFLFTEVYADARQERFVDFTKVAV